MTNNELDQLQQACTEAKESLIPRVALAFAENPITAEPVGAVVSDFITRTAEQKRIQIPETGLRVVIETKIAPGNTRYGFQIRFGQKLTHDFWIEFARKGRVVITPEGMSWVEQ